MEEPRVRPVVYWELNMKAIITGAISSIVATVCVLLSRLLFYWVKDRFPAGALFGPAIRPNQETHVYIIRMKDTEQSDEYITPLPQSTVMTDQAAYDTRQRVPWVASVSETHSVSHIFNVMGQCGKKQNMRLCFVDQEFDRWDVPMFLLGGSDKANRAFQTCNPVFDFSETPVTLAATGETFRPSNIDKDLGLLQKMTSPSTGFPIWVAMGWRGNGTTAATYALNSLWRELGALYGSEPFGILFETSDREGWQQLRIRRLYPEPSTTRKILHPFCWRKIARMQITE